MECLTCLSEQRACSLYLLPFDAQGPNLQPTCDQGLVPFHRSRFAVELSDVSGRVCPTGVSFAGPQVQIEGRTIFWRNRPTVSSSTIACGVVKRARTLQASDRQRYMGSTLVDIVRELARMLQSKLKLASVSDFCRCVWVWNGAGLTRFQAILHCESALCLRDRRMSDVSF